MIQIGQCYYMGPRIGDVSLMTIEWRDSEHVETIYRAAVPVVGGAAWWSWCEDAPAFVQQTLRKMYATVQAAEVDTSRGSFDDDHDDLDEETPPNGHHH